jgi:hypothetical protein
MQSTAEEEGHAHIFLWSWMGTGPVIDSAVDHPDRLAAGNESYDAGVGGWVETTAEGEVYITRVDLSTPLVALARPLLCSSPLTNPHHKSKMKSAIAAALTAALAAREVAGHAIFQELWVDGTDYISASSSHKP